MTLGVGRTRKMRLVVPISIFVLITVAVGAVPHPLSPSCVAGLKRECGKYLANGTHPGYYPCITCLENATKLKKLFAAGCNKTCGAFGQCACKDCVEYCPPPTGPNNPPICVPNASGTPANCIGPCNNKGEPWAPDAVCDRICNGIEYECCQPHGGEWWYRGGDHDRYCCKGAPC